MQNNLTQRIAEYRRLNEGRTKGPWQSVARAMPKGENNILFEFQPGDWAPLNVYRPPTADFIAASPSILSDLLEMESLMLALIKALKKAEEDVAHDAYGDALEAIDDALTQARMKGY
jgi:hypothetical protein